MKTVTKILELNSGNLMAGEFKNHLEALQYAAWLNQKAGHIKYSIWFKEGK